MTTRLWIWSLGLMLCLLWIAPTAQANPGDLFVAQSLYNAGNDIIRIGPDGSQSVFGTVTGSVYGLTFDPAGNMFASASYGGQGTIYRFTPDGTRSIFASGAFTTGGIAFDASGNLFLADEAHSRILRFNSEGAMSVFSDQSQNPLGIAFNSSGNLFVCSIGTNSLDEYTPGGAHQYFALGLRFPWGLVIDQNDTIFVTTYEVRDNVPFASIVKIFTDGTRSVLFEMEGGFNGLTMDDAGNLYASEGYTNSIIRITPDGQGSVFASGLIEPVALAFARGIPEPSVSALILCVAAIFVARPAAVRFRKAPRMRRVG
ncbi:MAG: hypothetical protein ABI992_09885 [Chthoniobacterales bacterium]